MRRHRFNRYSADLDKTLCHFSRTEMLSQSTDLRNPELFRSPGDLDTVVELLDYDYEHANHHSHNHDQALDGPLEEHEASLRHPEITL
jgi:hypothetical protein